MSPTVSFELLPTHAPRCGLRPSNHNPVLHNLLNLSDVLTLKKPVHIQPVSYLVPSYSSYLPTVHAHSLQANRTELEPAILYRLHLQGTTPKQDQKKEREKQRKEEKKP